MMEETTFADLIEKGYGEGDKVQGKSLGIRIRRDLGEEEEKPKKSPGSSTGGRKGGPAEVVVVVKKRKYECVDKKGESAVLESDPEMILEEGKSYILKDGFGIEEKFQQGQGLEKRIKLEKDAQVEEGEDLIDEGGDEGGAKIIDVAKDLTPIAKLASLKKDALVQIVGYVLKKSGGKDGELTTLTVGDHTKHCIEVDAKGDQDDVENGDLVHVEAVLEGDAGSKRLIKACWSKKDDDDELKEALKKHFPESKLSPDDENSLSYYEVPNTAAKYTNLSRVEIGELKNNKPFTRLDIKSIEDISNIKKLFPPANAGGRSKKSSLRMTLKNVKFYVDENTPLWYNACPSPACNNKGIDKTSEQCRNCGEKVEKPAHRMFAKAKIYEGRYGVDVMLDKELFKKGLFFNSGFLNTDEDLNKLTEQLWQQHTKDNKSYRKRLREAFSAKKSYDVTLLIQAKEYEGKSGMVESVDVKVVDCKESAAVMEE